MLGNPKYKKGEKVQFTFERNGELVTKTGYIEIIDAYGTFFKPDEVSYDIMERWERCLYKHVPESSVKSV